MDWAVVEDDKVVNVVVADEQTAREMFREVVRVDDGKPAMGWSRVDGEWVDPTPEPTPPERERVPYQVDAFQMRRALSIKGYREQVETLVEQSDDEGLKDAWEYQVWYYRDHPYVVMLQKGVGLTDAEVDEIFKVAAEQ